MWLQRLQAHRILMNTGAGWLAGGIPGARLDGYACLWRGLSVRVLGVLLAWHPCTCVKVYIDWCSVFFSKIQLVFSRSF